MTLQVLELLPPRAVSLAGDFKILKVAGRRLIGGYASVEVKDTQGETILVEALREAMDKFMAAKEYRNVHFMHSNVEVGKIIESVQDSEGNLWLTHVDDVGLFVVGEIDRPIHAADEVWRMIESGELRSFSIAGEVFHRTGPRGEIIDRLELHEITVCPEGANRPAKFIIIKGISPGTSFSGSYIIKSAEGKNYLLIQSEAQSLGDTVLEQRARTETEKEEKTKLDKEGKISTKTPPAAKTPADTPPPPAEGAPPAQDAEKESPLLLEVKAALAVNNELLGKLLTALEGIAPADAEKTDEEAEKPPEGEAPAVAAPTPAVDMKAEITKQITAVLKTMTPVKKTIVPGLGGPAGISAPSFDVGKLAKMPWHEVENLERQRKEELRGGAIP